MAGQEPHGVRAQRRVDLRLHRVAHRGHQLAQLLGRRAGPLPAHRGGVLQVGQQGVDHRHRDPVAVLVRRQPVQQHRGAGPRHGQAVQRGGGDQRRGEAAGHQGGTDPAEQHLGQDRQVQHGQFGAEALRLVRHRPVPGGGGGGVRLEDQGPVAEGHRAAHHPQVQRLLLLGREDVQRGQVLAEQQRGTLRKRGQFLVGRQFVEDLAEGVRGHQLGGDLVLGQQQRAQARHQVQVEQPGDPGADQRVQLDPGGPVTHQAVRVDGHRGAGEDLRDAQRGLRLDRLHGQLHVVVAQPPGQPEVTLPQHRVVRAGGPARGVERRDGGVPGEHLVEAVPQRREAGRLVQRRGGLGHGRVVGDQQDAAAGRTEAAGVQGRGQGGGAVEGRGEEDLGGHAAAPTAGRRRSRRSRVARSTSIESSVRSSMSCGIRRSAAAASVRSFRPTCG